MRVHSSVCFKSFHRPQLLCTGGEKPLRRWFKDYNDKWLKNCDFEFTDEFLQETNEVIAILIDRVKREEKILFPRLEQME